MPLYLNYKTKGGDIHVKGHKLVSGTKHTKGGLLHWAAESGVNIKDTVKKAIFK